MPAKSSITGLITSRIQGGANSAVSDIDELSSAIIVAPIVVANVKITDLRERRKAVRLGSSARPAEIQAAVSDPAAR